MSEDNTYSGGLTLTVGPKGLEISTANLTEEAPDNAEGRTSAILCAMLLRDAAKFINERASDITPEEIIEFLRSVEEDK